VVNPIETAVVRERENAFFGNNIIQLEFPTFTLTQPDLKRLLKRTFADSKWKAPALSAEGTSRKLMFFASVPA